MTTLFMVSSVGWLPGTVVTLVGTIVFGLVAAAIESNCWERFARETVSRFKG